MNVSVSKHKIISAFQQLGILTVIDSKEDMQEALNLLLMTLALDKTIKIDGEIKKCHRAYHCPVKPVEDTHIENFLWVIRVFENYLESFEKD